MDLVENEDQVRRKSQVRPAEMISSDAPSSPEALIKAPFSDTDLLAGNDLVDRRDLLVRDLLIVDITIELALAHFFPLLIASIEVIHLGLDASDVIPSFLLNTVIQVPKPPVTTVYILTARWHNRHATCLFCNQIATGRARVRL